MSWQEMVSWLVTKPNLPPLSEASATYLFFKFVLDRLGNSNFWISLQFVP